jgi:2-polyprenyl-3-methyl-5-hydroxy-6-metoxy-1,4-benzoquinol methylase
MVSAGELISRSYIEMQRTLHAAPRGYGGRGEKWAGIVLQVALAYDAHSILDYGCGQGSLKRVLSNLVTQDQAPVYRIDEYDPAIPGKDALPEQFSDLVNVTDVLEHIEPERLKAVLKHIRLLASKCVFVVISTKESNKVLADGRNAHVIIESPQWWKQQLREAGFTLHPPPSVTRVSSKEWVGVLTP